MRRLLRTNRRRERRAWSGWDGRAEAEGWRVHLANLLAMESVQCSTRLRVVAEIQECLGASIALARFSN
jgi:hypothetical protein